jgi:hypothetical protein
MKYKNFNKPRFYLDVPMEVMEALMRKSGEMGFGRADFSSAAYLVEALSRLTIEELGALLRRNDLLPEKEPGH